MDKKDNLFSFSTIIDDKEYYVEIEADTLEEAASRFEQMIKDDSIKEQKVVAYFFDIIWNGSSRYVKIHADSLEEANAELQNRLKNKDVNGITVKDRTPCTVF